MLRRTLRRLRFALFALVTTAIIALAVLIGLTQLAMPWLVRNPHRIEAWLSERLRQPVTIGSVDGTWVEGGPELTLDRVRIGSADNALEIPRAELALSLFAPFEHGRAWSEFRIVGLDVELARDASGWHMRGLDVGGAHAGATAPRREISMGALGVLVLKDFRLGLEDSVGDLHLALGASELRVVNQGATTHIAGKVRNLAADSTPIDLIADLDIGRRSGVLYAGGHDVDLGRFAAGRPFAGVAVLGGKGDAQVWITVSDARIDDVRTRVDVRDATLSAIEPIALEGTLSIVPRAHFDRVAFVARWLRQDGGWSADVADLALTHGDWPMRAANIGIEHHGGAAGDDYRAAASDLELEPLGSLAMLSASAPAGLRKWLYLARPEGTLAHADVRFRNSEDFDADASLQGAAFASADFVPGVEHLDANLHGDASALMIELPGQALTVEYPRVFRKPFAFSQVGGDIVAYRTDDAWRIETDRVVFEGEGYGGELRGGADIQDDHSRPLLDLYASVTHGEVTAAKLFWPTNVMPPAGVEYLDRALVEGRIDEGRVLVRGDLDSWPFHDNAGRFEARGHIVDTVFDYSPEWPRAEHLDAMATFIDDSMQVDADSAEVKGNRVTDATATIANFGEPVLELSAKGSGSGANLLGFLRASPVGKRYEDTLKDLEIGGRGELSFTLNLPVKHVEGVALDGTVALTDANLDDAALNLHFVDASGAVRFNQGGFAAGPLDVGFRQRPAKLSIAVGSYSGSPQHVVEASVSGRFPATTVFADVPDLMPALAHFPGESAWTAALTIDAAQNGAAEGRRRLTLSSDLRGIASDLPAPLAKSADTTLPFELALDLPFIGQAFSAKLGDLATARGRLPAPGKPFAARVEFGGEATEPLPEHGAAIGGHVSTLDAGGWLDRVGPKGDSGGGTGGLVSSVDVRTDDFTVAGRSLGATRLVIGNDVDATVLKLDGADLVGTLRIPAQNLTRAGVTADLDRFHWPDAPPDAPESNALADIAPGSLPPLHIAVKDFMLGKSSFGAATFESYPIANGMHIEKLESRSPNVNMTASGDWTGTEQSNRSHLVIALTAQNLGHMMDALGFPGLIDGGQTRADIDAIWPGPPSAFALSRLESGSITLNVAEGRILDVEPGAGRIFGLLSLSEIPRRLSLDFTDFFKSGLSFNSIAGTFRLDAGNAYTSNLLIKSPAADIAITGRTGLRAKDYDQQMIVSPHTGATLPLVGAIAAGPVGAAAGIVLQGVLGKPIGKAMGSRYHVSGTWEKPEITLIAKVNPRTQADEAKPGADAAKSPQGGSR